MRKTVFANIIGSNTINSLFFSGFKTPGEYQEVANWVANKFPGARIRMSSRPLGAKVRLKQDIPENDDYLKSFNEDFQKEFDKPDVVFTYGAVVKTKAKIRRFQTYKAWKNAVKKLDKNAKFTGDEDINSAFVKGWYNAEWDGAVGEIIINDDKKASVKTKAINNRVRDHLTTFPEDKLVMSFTNTVLKPNGWKHQDCIGWLATSKNPAAGFYLHAPDANDIHWFGEENESLDDVFRYTTDKGNTGLIKLDAKKGKVSFFDNKKYENTDKIYWMSPDKYQLLLVDPEGLKLLK